MYEDGLYADPEMLENHRAFAEREQRISEEIEILIKKLQSMDDGSNYKRYIELVHLVEDLTAEFSSKYICLEKVTELLNESLIETSMILETPLLNIQKLVD